MDSSLGGEVVSRTAVVPLLIWLNRHVVSSLELSCCCCGCKQQSKLPLCLRRWFRRSQVFLKEGWQQGLNMDHNHACIHVQMRKNMLRKVLVFFGRPADLSSFSPSLSLFFFLSFFLSFLLSFFLSFLPSFFLFFSSFRALSRCFFLSVDQFWAQIENNGKRMCSVKWLVKSLCWENDT